MTQIRTIQRHERDAVLDLLEEWLGDRAFFQRYFEHDPAFRDDRCLVAIDGDRFVSTLQIFPKTVSVGGVELRVAGIGNVFTTATQRGRGIASALLQRAVELMEQDGFDLSLLFATRLAFYGRLGWTSVRRLLGAVAIPEGAPSPSGGVRPFAPERDLEAVMDVYTRYNRDRAGAVVRDRRYWEGQLRYAGNPGETFLVAERGGRVAAYGRLTTLYGVETVIEHAAAPGERQALRDVFLGLAAQAGAGKLLLLHLGGDPELQSDLASLGLEINEVEDVFFMWRLIHPAQIAAKLRIAASDVEQEEFFERILPYRDSVYWMSDRF